MKTGQQTYISFQHLEYIQKESYVLIWWTMAPFLRFEEVMSGKGLPWQVAEAIKATIPGIRNGIMCEHQKES